jgi:hypothetical protein
MYPPAHGYWHRLLLVSLMLFAVLPTCARGDVGDYGEKATWIVNCARNTKWPDKKLKGGPFVIGVIGQDSMTTPLGERTVNLAISGHPVQVKAIQAPEEIVGCHVLFVSRSEMSRERDIIGKARSWNVLVFGESETFEKNGGMITFVRDGSRVRMAINKGKIGRAGLSISAEFLQLTIFLRVIDP